MANIGINISENGTTTLATAGKYCDRNIDVVVEVAGTGGGAIDEELLKITGNCSYRFANDGWNKFIELYGDDITTEGITNGSYMFDYSTTLKSIPFVINFGVVSNAQYLCSRCNNLEYFAGLDGNDITAAYNKAFSGCNYLKEIGTLKNLHPSNTVDFFESCYRLRNLPTFENFNYENLIANQYTQVGRMFSNCYSLRSIPADFLKGFKGRWTSSTYAIYSNMLAGCISLDEVRGIPTTTGTATSNLFTSSFMNCARLKEIIFDKQEDNTPYVASWKTQTIDLSSVGFATSTTKAYVLNYNSGITADKEVTDDTTYQALKNDVDWFTINIAYSRYNHDSAVNTINSLPDTSAYLASAGGTNTIKFKGAAGSSTDGGAINTLTDAEIAVAAAKGWTVSFA